MDNGPAFEAPTIEFRRAERDGDVALVVAGEIDLSTAKAFDDHLQALVADARSPVYVDLSQVSFFDSTALNALVGVSQCAAEIGVRVCLVEPSPQVRRVLAITGVTDFFDVVDSHADR